MGMAGVAPFNNSKNKNTRYQRHFYFDMNDGHVVEKLRERAPKLAEEVRYRSSDDLANWLDAQIVESIRRENMKFVIDDDGVSTQIVDLKEVTDQPIYAVLKPERGRPQEFKFRVMTILTHEQGSTSMKNGKWKPNKSVGTLGEKLAAVVLAPTPPQPPPVVAPTPVPPAEEKKQEITLVQYYFKANSELTQEEYPRGGAELKARLTALCQDQEVYGLRIFHEAKLTVKRVITVEVD